MANKSPSKKSFERVAFLAQDEAFFEAKRHRFGSDCGFRQSAAIRAPGSARRI